MAKRFLIGLLAVLAAAMPAFAQSTVSGKIVDTKGEGIPGANVIISGTKTGAISDLDGSYKLTGVSSKAVLEFSCLGYATKKVAVEGKSVINVVLEEDSEFLDDVVVIGYGTARRKDVSGAIASLNYGDNANIANLPNPNAFSALSSRVAGFNYSPTSSASGDNSATMTIRGMNAIPSGGSKSSSAHSLNQPLLVVDGVISYGSINEINTADIATIDVLKDASAAAIYGSRAANGVIVITTKRGASEKPTVRFDASVSLSDWSRRPEFVTDEDVFFRNRFFSKSAGDASLVGLDYRTYDKVNLMSRVENEAYNQGIYTDWIDEISRTGVGQKYDVSVSGKSAKTSYYVGSNYTRTQGIRLGDDYEKYSFLAKLDIDLASWLKVGVKGNFQGATSWGQPARIQNATWLSPYSFVKCQLKGYEDWYSSNPDGNVISPLWGTGSGDSYLWTDRSSASNTVNGLAYAQIDFPFLKGLSYRVTAQGRRSNSTSDVFSYPEIWVNTEKPEEMDNPGAKATNAGGSSSASKGSTWNIDNILTYTTDFGRNHIDAMVGYTRERYDGNKLSTSFSGYDLYPSFGYYDIASAANISSTRTRTITSAIAYLGRVNYNWANKYYLTANFRRDGYSVFADGHKWGNFYGASAAWVISNEEFMKNGPFDFLKLRLSYGENGSRTIGAYATTASVVNTISNGGTRTNAWLGEQSAYGVRINQIANKGLSWATSTKADLGIDFSVLGNRLNGTIDLYVGNTYDMLVSRSAPYYTGFSSVNANAGQVSNKGIELTLNSVNIAGDGQDKFRWESNLVFFTNKNKLEHLYPGVTSDVANYLIQPEAYYALVEGEPITAAYDYKLLGIFQSQEEIDNYTYTAPDGTVSKIMPDARPGDLKFEDTNNDGKISDLDRHVIGTTDPLFTVNFANTLSWKGFSLYFNFRWMQGDKTHFLGLDPNAFGTSMTSGNQLKQVTPWCDDKYYQNHSNTYPRYGYSNVYEYQYWNSRSFLKLKDLSFSYNLPSKLVSNVGLSAARVYVAATDLFTISNWSGLDPETAGTIASGSASTRYGSDGTYKTVTFGVNLTF